MVLLYPPMHTQNGVSLIEIMISLFILTVMLAGVDAIQLVALRQTRAAFYFAVAMQQESNMAERLVLGGVNDEQLAAWNQENKQLLPQGRGTVKGICPNFTIQIQWGDENACETNRIGETGCLYSQPINVEEC